MAKITAYLPGDILFFTAGNGSIPDEIISKWTDSRFVHVAVAISAIEKIEALSQGVVRTPIDARYVAAYYNYSALHTDTSSLIRALTWLHAQVGTLYGWGDIANAFLEKFVTNFAIDTHAYDCSALAAEFLMQAGGINWQGHVDPHEITPSMLANILGVK